MAYNEYLADLVRLSLEEKNVSYLEKRMMGGLCFMVDDKMCIGIVKEELMVRIKPELCIDLLESRNCRPMDFTGRPMNGYLFVPMEESEKDLSFWVDLCLDFNPLAKSSKKR